MLNTKEKEYEHWTHDFFFFSINFTLIANLWLLFNGDRTTFSEKTIRKLIIPQSSILRKLIILRESKHINTPFLYIRAVPYLLTKYLTLIIEILFFVDQCLLNVFSDEVFIITALVYMIVFYVYELIIFLLFSVFKV